MPKEEVIKNLEILKDMIEWEYPLDFQIVLDEAIRLLKEQKDG